MPSKYEQDFDRNTHYQYQLNRRFMKILQLLFQFINQVVITIILNMMMKKIIKTTEKYYFNVPPNLTINGKFVPFNNINVETVVSKWIGPYENWDKFFKIVAQRV